MTSPLYSISWHRSEKLIRLTWLTWLAGTEGMTDEDFRETLEVFAEGAMRHGAERLIIDVREFRHRPSKEILAWRDQVTVSKYNSAGVKRQAWIWPGDVSSLKPSSEKKAYQERYFSTEEEALSWVNQ